MIPNIFHFIYGLTENFGNKPFGLAHYLAIKSAIVLNKPKSVFFYYEYEPQTEYFKKIKPFLNLVKIKSPKTVYGNPLNHVAHQADIVRLLTLKLFGGIYMDLDTICSRSFEPLLNNSTVMGAEVGKNGENGLCNAVILAEKDAPYINQWLRTYQLFRSNSRDRYWGEHSIVIPKLLANYCPNSITQMPYDSFHYPGPSKNDINKMFCQSLKFENAYCHHLWESASWHYLENITEESIKNENTSYNVIAKRFILNEINEQHILSKSELVKIQNNLQEALLEIENYTEISYLNQHYYPDDYALLNEFKDIKLYYDKTPFCKFFILLARKINIFIKQGRLV